MPNGMSKLLHISDRYNYFSITQRYRISINSVKRAHGFLFLWEPSPVMGLSLTLISFWGLSPTTIVVGEGVPPEVDTGPMLELAITVELVALIIRSSAIVE